MHVYDSLRAAGVPLDHHESDLNAKVTPDSTMNEHNYDYSPRPIIEGPCTTGTWNVWHGDDWVTSCPTRWVAAQVYCRLHKYGPQATEQWVHEHKNQPVHHLEGRMKHGIRSRQLHWQQVVRADADRTRDDLSL